MYLTALQLWWVSFRDADLRHVCFAGSDLHEVDFEGADLRGEQGDWFVLAPDLELRTVVERRGVGDVGLFEEARDVVAARGAFGHQAQAGAGLSFVFLHEVFSAIFRRSR